MDISFSAPSHLAGSGGDIISQTSNTILFESKEAAREVAWTLRADWDNFTGVTLAEIDWSAVETAATLVKQEYCKVGARCYRANTNGETSSTFSELLRWFENTVLSPEELGELKDTIGELALRLRSEAGCEPTPGEQCASPQAA